MRPMMVIASVLFCCASTARGDEVLERIQTSRDHAEVLSQLLPIVHCSFTPSKYERILMTQLRSVNSSTQQFRAAAERIGDLLVSKVVDCLSTRSVEIATPVSSCVGEVFVSAVELVSIIRSGDALLDTFMKHFPDANISKILIQRDEKTAEPHFKYMNASPTLSHGNPVIITEPMIATGGTLEMAISLLKEMGVQEKNIIVASVCVAPEGLLRLCNKFPDIKVVMNVLDDQLNERKYIVPGLGDFGDRYFGTAK